MPGYMDAREGNAYSIEVADAHVCAENTQHSSFSFKTAKPVLMIQDSMGSEKHISVDPFSLEEPALEADVLHLPPLLPPSKSKFLSRSLPSSASSSPKFRSLMSSKKSRNLNQVSPLSAGSCLRQDSIALANNLGRLRENHILKSKSCGEGRTSFPPEELDLWMVKSSVRSDQIKNHSKIDDSSKSEVKLERRKSYEYEDDMIEDLYDKKVKCGALCMFLPGFGKAAKPITPRKDKPKDMVHFQEPERLEIVVSKRVSLEKFECGSWRSSVILDEGENQKDISNLFFDLPLEMIRSSANDIHMPVTTAFVFDKDRKGTLKKSSSRTAPLDSSRHVRFSTSSLASPTSCTAGDSQHKARDYFNSFLALKYL